MIEGVNLLKRRVNLNELFGSSFRPTYSTPGIIKTMSLLHRTAFKCSVSSVLNRDVKQHGKQFLYDGKEDTGWSSNEGTPQWISIAFEEPQAMSEFVFQFQGGFVGRDANVRIEKCDKTKCEEAFYPDDVNAVQSFKLAAVADGVTKVKFQFGASTDFFGRIIVYNLEIF